MRSGLGKVVKALVGLVVLVVLVVLVNGWYQQYQQESLRQAASQSAETSATAESTQVVSVTGGQRVNILTDDAVLRVTPSASASKIRSLKKGEQLLLVGTSGTWLQVRDGKNGRIGYVANVSPDVQVVR